MIDSTGLKVYGAGEWLQEKHGVRARRTWRKLHLPVDADTGMVMAGGAYDGAPTHDTVTVTTRTVGNSGARVSRFIITKAHAKAPSQSVRNPAAEKMMAVLDTLNHMYGRDIVPIGSSGIHKQWAMHRESKTLCYGAKCQRCGAHY